MASYTGGQASSALTGLRTPSECFARTPSEVAGCGPLKVTPVRFSGRIEGMGRILGEAIPTVPLWGRSQTSVPIVAHRDHPETGLVVVFFGVMSGSDPEGCRMTASVTA